jgi:ElaB/YqjD/DUF883 family membrane-anchored ribosome-binding protein
MIATIRDDACADDERKRTLELGTWRACKSGMSKTSTTVDTEDSPIEAIKARVSDLTDQAKESGTDALDRVQDLIENHPFESVGVAFAVGYVLKMLTGPIVTTGLLGAAAYLVLRPNELPKKRSSGAKSK